jgi:hypothetical protein
LQCDLLNSIQSVGEAFTVKHEMYGKVMLILILLSGDDVYIDCYPIGYFFYCYVSAMLSINFYLIGG